MTATSANGKSDNSAVTVTAAGAGGPGNLYSMSFESGNYSGLSNGAGGAPEVTVTAAVSALPDPETITR